ncbi:HxlR family transcriptional regulator [Lactobacillus sp. CBA3606]|uniref:winged helix-turn-helix transcriptional regulator n=1 Tax=Lactobacillus sp. CBA3606 TaxID=2099789 RepID=UPI000CFD1768|nr:winged helix-turn-helix transcriptional regulator [Lactobacillus sp. CBA3606]AVK63763.1 HxlR family transcriptional regulator [Lactobacillus sp. CBA3606]
MVMRDLNIGTKIGLELLTDKWYALTLSNLAAQPVDFMVLRQRVRGLSTLKLLTVLAKLTELKLVVSTADYAYGLTPTGLELKTSLVQLEAWGNRAITAMNDPL